MCTFRKVPLFIVLLIAFLNQNCRAAGQTPSFIKPCVDTKECLKDSIQASLPGFITGVPELGIGSLDPFIIRNLTLMLPGNLKVQFYKGVSKGLKKCVIDSTRMVGDTLDIQFYCNFTIKGKYRSTGQLLMFAINGDGNSVIRCKNIKFRCLVKFGSVMGQDGQKYLEITNFKSHHTYEGQVFYHMDNLIKGSPHISAAVVEFMNRNWKLVAEEFGKPIVDFGISSLLKNVQQLLKKVPMSQIVKASDFDV